MEPPSLPGCCYHGCYGYAVVDTYGDSPPWPIRATAAVPAASRFTGSMSAVLYWCRLLIWVKDQRISIRFLLPFRMVTGQGWDGESPERYPAIDLFSHVKLSWEHDSPGAATECCALCLESLNPRLSLHALRNIYASARATKLRVN